MDDPPATDPPITTLKTNIMDLTDDEEETTIVYEVENWSTTIKFVPAPVQPMTPRSTSTMKIEERVTSTEEPTTLGKIVFPDAITDLPGNELSPPEVKEEVVTHKTHRLDNMRGRGKGSGQAAVRAQSLLSLITCTMGTSAILVITTNLLL